MKRIIVFVVVLLLVIITVLQILNFFKFRLTTDYDYPAKTAGIDLQYHDPTLVSRYYETATKIGSFARESWFNYGIDVRLQDYSDTLSINASKTYDAMLVAVKQMEARLINSHSLKLDGFKNSDVKYMEENNLSPVEYTLIGTFQGKEYERGNLEPGVWEMQKLMNSIGQKIKIDGNFDTETEDAVRKFQEEEGLYPSGKADVVTLKRMITAHLKAQ